MKISDEALEAAAAALGLDLDDNFTAEVHAHSGGGFEWAGHVGEMLCAALAAATPHIRNS